MIYAARLRPGDQRLIWRRLVWRRAGTGRLRCLQGCPERPCHKGVPGGAGDVRVNAMCPGCVRTDMAGSGAPRSPEEAADTLAWLATLSEVGPNGASFGIESPSNGSRS